MTIMRPLITLLTALILCWPTSAVAQLGSVPYTFNPGTTILSAEVNANFATAYANALNRTGGTMTGTLTAQVILPDGDNTRNFGSAAASWASAWFDGTVTIATLSLSTLTCTGCVGTTQAAALDAGDVTTGTFADARLSSNVALRDVSNTFAGNVTLSTASGVLDLSGVTAPTIQFSGAAALMRTITNMVWRVDYDNNGTNTFSWRNGGDVEVANLNESGTFTAGGNVVAAAVDTGQGVHELYAMDQNVLTTSNVQFANLTLTGNAVFDGTDDFRLPDSNSSALTCDGATDNTITTSGSVVRLTLGSGAGNCEIEGGSGGASSGDTVVVINDTGQTVVLLHNDASAGSAGFFLPGAANISVSANSIVILWYDLTDSRWRMVVG